MGIICNDSTYVFISEFLSIFRLLRLSRYSTHCIKDLFYCSVLLLKADIGMEPRCPTSPHLLLSASIQQKVWFHNTLELDPAGVISSFVIPNPSKDHAYHRPSFTRALYQRKNTGVRREKQPLEYCYEKNKKTHKIQTS